MWNATDMTVVDPPTRPDSVRETGLQEVRIRNATDRRTGTFQNRLRDSSDEVCPRCNSTRLEWEPAWKGREPVGSRVRCRNCGWNRTSEEDTPSDAEPIHEELEQDLITVEALVGWLEGFRENAVEELQGTSNLDKADQRHLQSEVETLDKLIEFFDQGDTQ